MMSKITDILNTKVPLFHVLIGLTAGYVVYVAMTRTKSITSNSTKSKSNDHDVINNDEKARDRSDNEEEEDEDDDDIEYLLSNAGNIRNNYTSKDAPFKMMLCVNNSLGMGKGKVGAQCGHATLGAYKIAKIKCETAIKYWVSYGQAKIAVKIDDDQAMYEVEQNAKKHGLVTYIVEDAGRTQIAAGSKTVLAIGPAPESILKQVTGHLKLL